MLLNITDPGLECTCLGDQGTRAGTLRYISQQLSMRCLSTKFRLGTGGKSMFLAPARRIASMTASISSIRFAGGLWFDSPPRLGPNRLAPKKHYSKGTHLSIDGPARLFGGLQVGWGKCQRANVSPAYEFENLSASRRVKLWTNACCSATWR